MSGATYHGVIYVNQQRVDCDVHPQDVESRFRDAWRTFAIQLRRFLRFSEEVTRKSGITPLQYQLMLQIKGFPGREWANVAELAERLQAKHHGVVALISRCEEAGLVQRNASRGDQRRVEVQLTADGEECLEQSRHVCIETNCSR